jgi:hypothetical protein
MDLLPGRRIRCLAKSRTRPVVGWWTGSASNSPSVVMQAQIGQGSNNAIAGAASSVPDVLAENDQRRLVTFQAQVSPATVELGPRASRDSHCPVSVMADRLHRPAGHRSCRSPH